MELQPRLFWRLQVPLVTAFVALISFLSTRGWVAIPPRRILLAAGAHLLAYGATVYGYRPGWRGRALYIVVPIVNLSVIGVIAESTRNPGTAIWGFLILYSVVLSQAFGTVASLGPAIVAVPFFVGVRWAYAG